LATFDPKNARDQFLLPTRLHRASSKYPVLPDRYHFIDRTAPELAQPFHLHLLKQHEHQISAVSQVLSHKQLHRHHQLSGRLCHVRVSDQ